MKKVITLGIAAAIALVTSMGSASASHEHWLQTPGTCVEDIASGQTSKLPSDPGGHKFHDNVHTGTPGTFAFNHGPVSVGKGEGCG